MQNEGNEVLDDVDDKPGDRLVCLCYKLTEGQIVKAIQGGANTMQKLAEQLKVAERCEGCVMDALELLQMHADGFDWNSREQLHIEGDLPYQSRAAKLASSVLPRALFNKLMDYVDVGHFMSTIWLAGPDVATRVFVSNHVSS